MHRGQAGVARVVSACLLLPQIPGWPFLRVLLHGPETSGVTQLKISFYRWGNEAPRREVTCSKSHGLDQNSCCSLARSDHVGLLALCHDRMVNGIQYLLPALYNTGPPTPKSLINLRRNL